MPDEAESIEKHSANGGSGGPDPDEIDRLLPAVYQELHAVAQAVLASNRTIDPARTTSLVNDVYVRLAHRGLRFRDRSHFLALAARAMRNVLIDRARGAAAEKRGGAAAPLALNEDILQAARAPDLLALDEALNRLAVLDAGKARIVELRYFGGLSVEETATAAGISAATVKREWTLARAWLYRELNDRQSSGS